MLKDKQKNQAITKEMRIKYSLVSGLLFVFIAGVVILINQPTVKKTVDVPGGAQEKVSSTYNYSGKNSSDALSLLKQKVQVEQDSSGLVVVINGRRADAAKKEFWAFYVNGKMSDVGPADYITKDSDVIEWRVQSY